MFAPFADKTIVNPFVHSAERKPTKADLIWGGFNHPCINHMRRLIRAAGEHDVLACVNLAGEPNRFRKRKASFEEIEWMVYAAIGSGFRGLVWRGNRAKVPWDPQLRRLEADLKRHAKELGSAKPVGWIIRKGSEPCSALLSGRKLFLVLLDPSYMKGYGTKKGLQLPLEETLCKGIVVVETPLGVTSVRGCNLAGSPVHLIRRGRELRIPYEFSGGGNLIILTLRDDRTQEAKTPRSPRHERRKP
jgi:hypothetical protein